MESFDYKSLPQTPYSSGTYVVLHHGEIPADGFALSQVKVVAGWPNPVLEASRREDPPTKWIGFIDRLATSNERPLFNMGIYQVYGKNLPAAVYGPLEDAHPAKLVIFRGHLATIPDEMQHLAHFF